MYYVGFVNAIRTLGGLVRRYLRSGGLTRRLQVINALRFYFSVLSVMVLLLQVVRVSIAGRIRGVYGISTITLRRLGTRVCIIRG